MIILGRDEMIRRYRGCQTFFKEGCLFFCLLSIAEEFSQKKLDCLDILAYTKKMGYIDENNEMTEDSQVKLLRDLTGKQWKRSVLKELPLNVPDEMYTVEKWLNPRTGFTHFRRRYVDTLIDSVTVKEGTLVAYYAYTWR